MVMAIAFGATYIYNYDVNTRCCKYHRKVLVCCTGDVISGGFYRLIKIPFIGGMVLRNSTKGCVLFNRNCKHLLENLR